MGKQRTPRTRNAGTMTEAGYRGWIRSQLRRMSLRWRPIGEKRKEGRRAVTKADQAKWGKRIKVVNSCEECAGWFPNKELEIDHIKPAGQLLDIAKDAGPFITRLLCEKDGLRRLCKGCHAKVTNA